MKKKNTRKKPSSTRRKKSSTSGIAKTIFAIIASGAIIYSLISYNLKTEASDTTDDHTTTSISGTIIIGDSRIVEMCTAYDDCHTTGNGKEVYNDDYIAKNGSGLSWLQKTALDKLSEKLSGDKKYNIVIILGVNDVKNANSYADFYLQLATGSTPDYSYWKNHNIIIAAVSPINDTVCDEQRSAYGCTSEKKYARNKDVIKFNATMSSKLAAAPPNLKYCAATYYDHEYIAYDNTTTPDGLHFIDEVSRSIHDTIFNKCL